ncbi:ATP-binding protein [Aetokthonos hydrillicola Thurmond2011]|jgi:light-regulated signal transduction histidine kinase (bacteriophytochrome)|uniref:histidine kinase n=1 Tax=Aetokthonos hydrillicola Thurmond2011 TaxID=2712845 RepID=A0AAP5IAN9_9CYAN|nr:ATP-binding protein [Aetokthonos hydrillicola]MBO3457852.1 GAF domain-containing protein [Aetokthonos hydrillicola CCALA 1050]MBW4587338.1 GAF domain-containing protein [Aetokthonos hydrillicola CCALA 1050]MDR9896637.1 ATP-binding protein [Aetokthonos hydrillicola Thurmond2011]
MSDYEIITQDVDFNDCDNEPIHIPGSIQPHGLLFVLKEPELTILQVSNNTFRFFGLSADKLIDHSLDIIFDKYYVELIKMFINQKDFLARNPIKLSISLSNRNLLFDGILHRRNGILILELELSRFSENIYYLNSFDLVRAAVSKMQNALTLDDLCQTMVKEVRSLNGFDRVMVYRFDHEGHGTVIAEDKLQNMSSFLGLCYPTSDVPKQARKLYCLNWLRLIADVNYRPVEIIPSVNPITNSPVDLSLSVLRSVSPFHVEYLQNMGVKASMSISLIKDDKLWGLIACHHHSPKFISYEVRQACEFLGQVMSLELTSKEDSEDYEYKFDLKNIQVKILEYMSKAKNFIEGLVNYKPNLLDLVNAQGAVVCFDGNCTQIGKTPQGKDLKRLLEWLENNLQEEVFYTNFLSSLYKEAEKFKDIASGLLVILISRNQKNYILWFRTEVIQTVNWAGNPNQETKSTSGGRWGLSPRKSFDLWKETVRLKSLPWKKCEIEAALQLRNAVVNIVLHQVDELAKLNAALQESEAQSRQQATHLEKTLRDLQLAQAQLIQTEKMSSLGQMVAGVAHEINNPINFIHGNLSHVTDYTTSLLNLIYLYKQYYPSPPEVIQSQAEDIDLDYLIEDLPKILSSMRVGTERIRGIVLSLRKFSRLDESDMKPVDINQGIDSTLLILQHRLQENNYPTIEIIKEYENLPLVECYAGQLNQVFLNIIVNAIDALEVGWQDQASTPKIKIRTEITQPQDIDQDDTNSSIKISIADNGPGISKEIQPHIFDPFFTTKPVGKGTGLGLAISYQIIEKHGGQLTCLSTSGQGSEFVINIPIRQKGKVYDY